MRDELDAQIIRESSQRLGFLPTNPIAVYGDSGHWKFIHDINVRYEMRSCSIKIYKLT